MKKLKENLLSKAEHAEDMKKSADRHAKLIDQMLTAHQADLARKVQLEKEEKDALAAKVEKDLKEQMEKIEQDERQRIQKQVQDEYDRKKREAETKRLVEQAEARLRRQMEEAKEQRRKQEGSLKNQCDRAAAEQAARDKVLGEARRQAAMEKEARMNAMREAKSKL